MNNISGGLGSSIVVELFMEIMRDGNLPLPCEFSDEVYLKLAWRSREVGLISTLGSWQS